MRRLSGSSEDAGALTDLFVGSGSNDSSGSIPNSSPRSEPSRFGDQVGPYRLEHLLGEGGMSLVFSAVDERSKDRVALKMVRAPNPTCLASIRREVHALRRLDHPGIVKILDEGVHAGLPYLAMELLDGETLEGFERSLWGTAPASSRTSAPASSNRQTMDLTSSATNTAGNSRTSSAQSRVRAPAAGGDLTRAMRMFRRICAPLGFLHGEGLVHCDLKPQNIFVLANDRPILVDFGLAWRVRGKLGRETTEGPTRFAGTPHYMAPEQILNFRDLTTNRVAIDARADLYALGCLLFELLTGRPPFQGGHDVLVRHLSVAPSPPSAFAEGIDIRHDRLVLALLEKDPRQRMGHIEDVVAALDALGVEPDPIWKQKPPRPHLYRPAMVGRDTELDELVSLVDRAKQGQGVVVLLRGESGIGKTYLATEVARRAAEGLYVVTGSSRAAVHDGGQALSTLSPLFESVADLCVTGGPERTDVLLGRAGGRLAGVAPALRRAPGIVVEVEADPEDPAAARERLLTCLREVLGAVVRERPLLLLIDDLQWADELTLQFLSSLPRDWLAGHALVVLATWRSDESMEAFGELASKPYVQTHNLAPIDSTTVASIASDMLAISSLPPDLVEYLTAKTNGNPLFVAEYLRAALSEGLIRRGDIANGFRSSHQTSAPPSSRANPNVKLNPLDELGLPKSIRELLALRVSRLTPQARLLLEVGSLIGKHLDFSILLQAAQVHESVALDGLGELVARDLLEAEATSEVSFRFVHDRLREVTASLIEAERKTNIHRDIAHTLVAQHGHADADAIASHFDAARQSLAAHRWYVTAGDQALEQSSFASAIRCLSRALELRPTNSPEQSRITLALARAHFAQGHVVESARCAREVLVALGEPIAESRGGLALSFLSGALTQVGHRLGLRRSAAVEDRDRLHTAAVATSLLTHRYFYADDALAMLCCSVRAVNLAERAHVEHEVPRALTFVGFLSSSLRQPKLARYYFAAARRSALQRGELREIAFGWNAEAIVDAGHGRFRDANVCVQQAETALEALGHDPLSHEWTLTTRGHVSYFQGRFHEALGCFEALGNSAAQREHDQHLTWSLFSQARSLVAIGQYAEALPLLEESLERLALRPELPSQIIAGGLLARVCYELGRPAEARRVARETLVHILGSSPTGFPVVEGYAQVIYVLAKVRQDPTELAQARRALRALSWMFPVAQVFLCLADAEIAASQQQPARVEKARKEAMLLASSFGMSGWAR